MAGTAPQIREMTTDELRIISIDFSAMLDGGELLTGAPDVQCSDDLTITDAQINAAIVDINGASVAAGMAVQFKVTAAVAAQYKIEIVCDTDAGQTVEGTISLRVKRSRF